MGQILQERSWFTFPRSTVPLPHRLLAPVRFEEESNAVVLWASHFVARSLSSSHRMEWRLTRTSSEIPFLGRFDLLLKSNWN